MSDLVHTVEAVESESGREVAPSEPIAFNIYGGMISAVGDVEGRKYRLCRRGNGRRWVVADQIAAAENIYADGGHGSQGFGGRKITFELVDGGSVEFEGPWKASATGLFEETGVDVRDRYYTRGIVAFERASGSWPGPDLYSDVAHYDPEPVLGTYDRIDVLAAQIADATGRAVYYGKVSKGGGSAGRKTPSDGGDGVPVHTQAEAATGSDPLPSPTPNQKEKGRG